MYDEYAESNLLQIAKRHQALLSGLILFLVGFLVVSANAIWNQSGIHPAMIMKPVAAQQDKTIRLSRDPIPVRRVAVKPIVTTHLTPVPSKRPDGVSLETTAKVQLAKVERTKIAQLQEILIKANYLDDTADGYWGPKTEHATEKFAQENGLSIEALGMPGGLEALLAKIEEPKAVSPKPSVATQEAIANLVRQNEVSPTLVAKVQIGLINFGNRDIQIDGIVGKQTSSAIEEFEKRFDMPVTGKPTPQLIKKLYSVGALTR